MKGSVRNFALSFVATAILFAPAAAAQAPGIGQTICRLVWDWGSGRYMRVCNSVYYPPPPAGTTATVADVDRASSHAYRTERGDGAL